MAARGTCVSASIGWVYSVRSATAAVESFAIRDDIESAVNHLMWVSERRVDRLVITSGYVNADTRHSQMTEISRRGVRAE